MADLLSVDVARSARSAAIHRFDVGSASGHSQTVFAIASGCGRFVRIIGPRNVSAIRGTKHEQVIGFLPLNLVDAHDQSAVGAAGGGSRQIRQRKLMQREFLQRSAGIAVAQHFALSLAVRRFDHVAVDRDVGGVVLVGEVVSQVQDRVHWRGRNAPGEHLWFRSRRFVDCDLSTWVGLAVRRIDE